MSYDRQVESGRVLRGQASKSYTTGSSEAPLLLSTHHEVGLASYPRLR